MASMLVYSKAAVERAMKAQEVILQALAKKITWWRRLPRSSASVIGICGVGGSLRRVRPGWTGRAATRQAFAPSSAGAGGGAGAGIYWEKYFDLNVRHFHERLVEERGIGWSHTCGERCRDPVSYTHLRAHETVLDLV